MQLVVLAGGFGTRLRGAIPDGLPKPMASIAGRPFLERLFDNAIVQGVNRIHLLVGYSAEVITGHFGSSYRDVPVTYSFEHVPLGTGGALKAAMSQLDEEFVVANGDTFVEVAYEDLLKLLGCEAMSMSVAAVEDASRYGSVIVTDDVIVGLREKGMEGPGLINAGVYACRRDLLLRMPDKTSFSFEMDFLTPELPNLRPRFQLVDSGIIDFGTPESYAIANAAFGRAM